MATAQRLIGSYRAVALPLSRLVRIVDQAPAAAYFALVCLAVLLVWSQTLSRAFEFDDINVLYKSIVRAPNFLYLFTQFDGQTTGGSWRPMLHVLMWLEWHLFGTQAFFYHLVSALLHAGAVFVLAAIALELTGRNSTARLVGAIFLVQPLPEAIGWNVGGGLNVQSTLFYFAALLFHIKSRRRNESRLELVALAFLVLSLLSYEVALTWLGPMIAYDVLFHWQHWTPRQRAQRTGAMTLAVFAIIVVFVLTRAWILGVFLGSYGATAVFGFASIPTRFRTVLGTLWTPVNTSMPPAAAIATATRIFEISVVAAVAAVIAYRAALRPIVLGVVIAVCAIVPFAGFIAITPGLISSRYLYPSIGGLALAVGAALGDARVNRRSLGVVVAAALIGSSAMLSTFNQIPWAVAGRMVDDTVRAASTGPLQVFGVPIHDYHGAYTFGTESNIPEYPGAYGIDVLTNTATVQPGRRLMYWDGSALVPLATPPIAAWSATDLNAWNWSQTATLQVIGDGLLLTSRDGDPWGWSPTLAIPSERTNVVVVTMETAQAACTRTQLISRFTLTGDRNVSLDLLPGRHDYVFAQPTAVLGDTLVGLRFDPIVCPGTITVFSLQVGGRGPGP